MAHQLMISDETYASLTTLAQERGQTPDEFALRLLQQGINAEWEADNRGQARLIRSAVYPR